MIKILFVCYGNICRSPMAEFIMKDIVWKNGYSDKFIINSRAISNEEQGNYIYPKALNKLEEKGISVFGHHAKKITQQDYDSYDYIIAMDDSNISALNRMFGNSKKVYKLLYFVGNSYDIADPWYTDDFEKSYQDIHRGCLALYKFLEKNNKIY